MPVCMQVHVCIHMPIHPIHTRILLRVEMRIRLRVEMRIRLRVEIRTGTEL